MMRTTKPGGRRAPNRKPSSSSIEAELCWAEMCLGYELAAHDLDAYMLDSKMQDVTSKTLLAIARDMGWLT